MKDVVIVDYNAGNLFSLASALRRLGYSARIETNVREISNAVGVIIPGVGNFATAKKQLVERGFDELIPQLAMPVLGICLGMQLLGTHSEESIDDKENPTGLHIVPMKVERFHSSPKIPHMGWNSIASLQGELFVGIPEHSYVYFVHSYKMPPSQLFTTSVCTYGEEFSASLQNKNVFAVQFHPEKSGEIGIEILKNYLSLL
jgi:glutamine amidotransferase